jgi:hypothetical protein
MIRKINEYFYNNKAYVILFLIFIVIVIFLISREKRTTNKILKSGVFVTGRIVKIRHTRGTTIEYEYNFIGQKFHSSEGMHVINEYVGAMYLIKINPNSPSESRLLKDYFIPDSVLLQQPDSGWTSNPVKVN